MGTYLSTNKQSSVKTKTADITVAEKKINDSTNNAKLIPTDTSMLISKMIQNQQLNVATEHEITQHKQKFELMPTTQYIIGASVSIPHTDWKFTFHVYFPYLQSIDNDKFEKVYVYTTFHTSYDQLEKIDKIISKRMSSGYKYFTDAFDKAHPFISKGAKYESILKKRGEILAEEMKMEQLFMKKPKLPSKKKSIFSGVKPATTSDLISLANYLNILLSSPSLCQESFVFEELSFSEELKLLIKSFATHKLETLKTISDTPSVSDPSKLLNYKHDFHTFHIVRRSFTDSSLKLFGFNHWAIKMEGKTHLMTVEFLPYNDTHGIVKIQILENTSMNRRVFWYWWPCDENNKDNDIYFTSKWTVISTIYVGSINIDFISQLLITWLSIERNYAYSVSHNNCQHFARDLCTIFDMKIARKLNGFMDHTIIAATIPAAALVEGMTEEVRCNEAYNKLIKTAKKYKFNQREQKCEENENEFDLETEKETFENKFETEDQINKDIVENNPSNLITKYIPTHNPNNHNNNNTSSTLPYNDEYMVKTNSVISNNDE
eukprot:438454_1